MASTMAKKTANSIIVGSPNDPTFELRKISVNLIPI